MGFGTLTLKVEDQLLKENDSNASRQRLAGIIACLVLILPPVFLLIFIQMSLGENSFLVWFISIIVLYLVIGAKSLEDHGSRVASRLKQGDLEGARNDVANIVSRNTENLDEEGVCKATIESVLENGSDAIFAAFFWFLIAGAPAALCYRLVNTLDAMWGYRNNRYQYFGWAVARLDDIMNWLPARLTVLTYALMGNFKLAIRAWREQAHLLESPNAGPVMAGGAGALNLTLGGPAIYHGKLKEKPSFGYGPVPVYQDIYRALSLVRHSIYLWLFLALILAGIL